MSISNHIDEADSYCERITDNDYYPIKETLSNIIEALKGIQSELNSLKKDQIDP